MGRENINFCRICHSEFETDLYTHSTCLQIKQEFQDSNYNVGQNGAKDSKFYELPSNEKINMDVEKPAPNQKPKKLCICGICNKGFKDNYRLRRHESQVHTKDWNLIQPDNVFEPKTKIETQCAQDYKDKEQFNFEYTDVELSEAFLSEVLRLVDELCDVINKGDSNFERTVKVIQNLKDDVSCYRNKLGRNFLTGRGKLIENDRNPNVNSYEFEEHIDNPLHDIKSESFELDNNSFVEHEETMKLEPNIENSNSDGLSLVNQFEKCGKNIVDKGTYICENCGFTADTLGRIERHVDVMHQNSLNCSHCDSKFPQIMHLEYHIEGKHPGTSELKYFCSECGDGFMYQRNMKRHLRKHKKKDESVNKEKKLQECSICSKRFLRRQFLSKHIERVHEIPKASLLTHMETYNETDSIPIDGVQEQSEESAKGGLISESFII